jgi:hypothetical protein
MCSVLSRVRSIVPGLLQSRANGLLPPSWGWLAQRHDAAGRIVNGLCNSHGDGIQPLPAVALAVGCWTGLSDGGATDEWMEGARSERPVAHTVQSRNDK